VKYFNNGFSSNGFDSGFSGFATMFGIVFFLIIGVFIFIFIKGITQWNKNNHSPRLIVDAVLISKRTDVSHHHHDSNPNDGIAMHSSTSTSYYITFQFESGDRMEFQVSGQEFGLLVEGDRGKLTFQGTRYLGFERT
jgi:hypothetical protein